LPYSHGDVARVRGDLERRERHTDAHTKREETQTETFPDVVPCCSTDTQVLADRFMIGSSQKSAVEQFKLRLDQCKQFSWGIWARDLAHEKKPEIVDGVRKLVDTVLETPAWLNSFTAMR